MSKMVNILAQIPEELEKVLEQISRDEERSKNYYIKKGLENFLKQRQQAIQLEKNIAISLRQIENNDCHEANDEFWQNLKSEVVKEIKAKNKIT